MNCDPSISKNMPNRCFVTNCNSGYDAEVKFCRQNGVKPTALFKAPSVSKTVKIYGSIVKNLTHWLCLQNCELLKKWQASIPRLDRVLSSSNYVCEKHFSEKCVERYYRTKLKDNTEHLIPRDHPVLLPGAVPTKFPGCPRYLSKRSPIKRNERKVPNQSSSRRAREVVQPQAVPLPLEPVTSCTPASQASEFDELRLQEFSRNGWARCTVVVGGKTCIRYLYCSEEQYLLSKYVDVDETLSVRVRTLCRSILLICYTLH